MPKDNRINIEPGQTFRLFSKTRLRGGVNTSGKTATISADGAYVDPNQPPPVVVVPPVVIPPIDPLDGVVTEFLAGATAANVLAAIKAGNQDAIKLEPGAYPKWGKMICNVERPKRPLIVEMSGAILSGGNGTDGGLYVGFGGLASDIEFRGPTFDGYKLTSTGVAWFGMADRVTLRHTRMVNCKGVPSQSHGAYVSAGGHMITIDDLEVVGTDRSLSAIQTYHTPGVQGLILHNVRGKLLRRGILAWGNATGLVVDDCYFQDCDRAYDFKGDDTGRPTGTIGHCSSVRSASASDLGILKQIAGTNDFA